MADQAIILAFTQGFINQRLLCWYRDEISKYRYVFGMALRYPDGVYSNARSVQAGRERPRPGLVRHGTVRHGPAAWSTAVVL